MHSLVLLPPTSKVTSTSILAFNLSPIHICDSNSFLQSSINNNQKCLLKRTHTHSFPCNSKSSLDRGLFPFQHDYPQSSIIHLLHNHPQPTHHHSWNLSCRSYIFHIFSLWQNVSCTCREDTRKQQRQKQKQQRLRLEIRRHLQQVAFIPTLVGTGLLGGLIMMVLIILTIISAYYALKGSGLFGNQYKSPVQRNISNVSSVPSANSSSSSSSSGVASFQTSSMPSPEYYGDTGVFLKERLDSIGATISEKKSTGRPLSSVDLDQLMEKEMEAENVQRFLKETTWGRSIPQLEETIAKRSQVWSQMRKDFLGPNFNVDDFIDKDSPLFQQQIQQQDEDDNTVTDDRTPEEVADSFRAYMNEYQQLIINDPQEFDRVYRETMNKYGINIDDITGDILLEENEELQNHPLSIFYKLKDIHEKEADDEDGDEAGDILDGTQGSDADQRVKQEQPKEDDTGTKKKRIFLSWFRGFKFPFGK